MAVRLDWTPPAAGSSPITSYQIRKRTSSVSAWVELGTSSTNTYTDNSGTLNHEYQARAVAGTVPAAQWSNVAPAVAPATLARYAALGGNIVDPDGDNFVPVGANLLGHDHFWVNYDMNGRADDALLWGWNAVRFDCSLPDLQPTWDHVTHGTSPAPDYIPDEKFRAVVKEYTDAGLVVMSVLRIHQNAGQWPTANERLKAIKYWTSMANLFKDNPKVWFNVYNEPGNAIPVPQVYYDIHAEIQNAIRSTGAKNLIVIDGTQWGQDRQWDPENPPDVPSNQSGILTYGPQLVDNDPVEGGTAFSIHPYAPYGRSTDSSVNDARLVDFITRVRAAGLTLMFGEYGDFSNKTLSSPERRGAEAVLRVAPAQGVGTFAWHGIPGDGFSLTTNGPFYAIDSPTNPQNLTALGRKVWQTYKGDTDPTRIWAYEEGTIAGTWQYSPYSTDAVPTGWNVYNTLMYSSLAGSTATLRTPATTSITLRAELGTGQFTYSLDGGAPVTVDTYAVSSNRALGTALTLTGLANTTHTLVITVLGAKNASSPTTQVAIENVQIGTGETPPVEAEPTTIQNTDIGTSSGQVEYSGGFGTFSTWTYNTAPGTSYRVRFTGTRACIYGSTEAITADVRVDGGSVQQVVVPNGQALVFDTGVLSSGAHDVLLTNVSGALTFDYATIT